MVRMSAAGCRLAASLAAGAAILASAGAAGAAGGWSFSWSDEFGGAAVDASVWGYENGYVRNSEAQYYTNRAENSRIEDGKLLIRALRDNWNGNEYTSASRTTRGKKSWKYGRFEMRARIDIRAGSWPAWWWLPNTGGWPKGGEIDMMEYYQNKLLFNVMDGSGRWTAPTRSISSLGGARWAEEYHTWTMEWDSTRIDLSLDGAPINHYVVDSANGTGPNGNNPFRQPGYLLVNQALGGTNGGDHTRTAYPVDYRIDWIRVHVWDPAAAAVAVTVKQGAGSGTYAAGTKASLTARMPEAGQVFDRWVVEGGGAAVIDDAASPAAILTVPAAPVTVTATFKTAGTPVFRGPRGRAWLSPLPESPLIDARGRRIPEPAGTSYGHPGGMPLFPFR